MTVEQDTEKKINEIAEEICDREGFIFYDLEYLPNQKVVRIFIDSEKGVTLDDCAKVSQGVNLLLDIEDPIATAYNLEVSSPGLERRLSKKWHYEAQLNKEISVVIKARTESAKRIGAKNIKGVLSKVKSESFSLTPEKGEDISLPYTDVHRCNVVFKF